MRHPLVAALLAAALLLGTAAPAAAGDPVKDRQAAQARANAAAAKFAKAESSLAKIERELKSLEAKTNETRGRLTGLEGEVRQVSLEASALASEVPLALRRRSVVAPE